MYFSVSACQCPPNLPMVLTLSLLMADIAYDSPCQAFLVLEPYLRNLYEMENTDYQTWIRVEFYLNHNAFSLLKGYNSIYCCATARLLLRNGNLAVAQG